MAKEKKSKKTAEENVEEITTETVEESEEGKEIKNEESISSKEDELNAEIAALKDKIMRNAAEFDNFKKRTAKEREELYSMGVCSAVEKLLAVKDNLERAIPTFDGADAVLISDGIKMIDKQFSDVLSEMGVEAIPSIGEEFDPEKHNAVMHDENDEFGENTISEEFMKGYTYKDKVIRHSMVKVSN